MTPVLHRNDAGHYYFACPCGQCGHLFIDIVDALHEAIIHRECYHG